MARYELAKNIKNLCLAAIRDRSNRPLFSRVRAASTSTQTRRASPWHPSHSYDHSLFDIEYSILAAITNEIFGPLEIIMATKMRNHPNSIFSKVVTRCHHLPCFVSNCICVEVFVGIVFLFRSIIIRCLQKIRYYLT